MLLRINNRTLYAIIMVCSLSCHAESTSVPLNTAAVVGETVTFNCRIKTTKSIAWKYVNMLTSGENFIFKDGNVTDQCENCSLNRTEPGQYDLVISSVKLTDAGYYKCLKSEPTDNKNDSSAEFNTYSGELIVLDPSPKCSTNLTKANGPVRDVKSVLLWCVVEFRGRFGPVMLWKNERTGNILPSTINISPNIKVESEVVVDVDVDNVISCVTFFNQSTFGDKHAHDTPAENIPTYNYTWTFIASTWIQYDATVPTTMSSSQRTDENSSFPQNIVSVFVPVFLIFFVSVVLLLICITLRKSQRGCFRKGTVNADAEFEVSHQATERIYYEDPTGLLHGEESSNDNMDNRTQEDPAHRSNESTLYEDITTEERYVENASNGIEYSPVDRYRNRRRIPNEIDEFQVTSTERRTRMD